jgi:class 3 adenylate cyclase
VPQTQRKPLASPEQVRPLGKGRVDLVGIGETMVGHAQFEPGWRWSTDVKHIVGTEWCEIRHIGYCLGGRLHVLDENGAESEIGPGDVYEIVPGHDAWVVGEELFEGVEFASSRQFGESANEPADRVVATILFTDIVDSTRHLSDMGDLRWRNVLLEHNKEMRRQLDGFRGREIDTTGDGFVALFDSAARAARCARSMTHAVEPLGLEIRAGLHTGEVEKVGGNVRGVAVHVAARVMSLAGAGEVAVSSTTADLLSGSGLELESIGRHELKGVPGDREIFRLTG